MDSKWSPLNTLGMLALAIFTIFTLTSVAFYPTPYNPLYDWLSNLGNSNLNPSGAIFFNWGCIITGIILIPFFIGLYRWHPVRKWSKILLVLGMLLGIFASVSLISVGFFPETHIKLHVLAASGVFGSIFLIIILLNISLYKNPEFMRPVTYWGILAIIMDLSFKIMLSQPQYKDLLANFNPTIPVPGLEWLTVYTSLIWIALLSYNMWNKKI